MKGVGGDKLQKPTRLYKLNDGVKAFWTKKDQGTFLQDTVLFSILIPGPRTMPGTHKEYDIFLSEIIKHKSGKTSSEKTYSAAKLFKRQRDFL